MIYIILCVLITLSIYSSRKYKLEKTIFHILATILCFQFASSKYLNQQLLALFLQSLVLLDIYKKKFYIRNIIPGFLGVYWLTVVDTTLIISILTIIAFSSLYLSIEYVFKRYLGFPIFGIILYLTRIGSSIINMYRFGNLTIYDILSLPTAVSVSEGYELALSTPLYFMLIEIIFFSVFYIAAYEGVKYSKLFVLKTMLIFFVSIVLIGLWSQKKQEIIEAKLNPIESLTASIIEEVMFQMETDNKEIQIKELKNFKTEDSSFKPNIICILCESFSDLNNALNITMSRNPLSSFYALENKNTKIGTVQVDTFGGGTSKSEWEFLTGLDISKYSKSQNPFLGHCKENYAITSDPTYSKYEKTFIHPFNEMGWNRKQVYKNFGYDNLIFTSNTAMNDTEKIGRFISDKYIYREVCKRLNNESPQFIKIVTMQNHGAYNDLILPNKIAIEENFEHKEEIENYLTLVEQSSKSIVSLINHLENHKEEPTLVIFYGDHYPGGIFEIDKDVRDQEQIFKTPYLVYSNYTELDEIPKELDLSLLYSYAKKTGKLNLTQYEQYLVSLDGKTPNKEFIISRIKNGAIESSNTD